jgi:hypothetical protein
MNFILPDWPVGKAVAKSVIWCFWSGVLGLLPFLIVSFIGMSFTDLQVAEKSTHEVKHLFSDFVILFFCNAMIGEITIEAFLSKVRFGKYSYLGFCSASFAILFVTCILYSVLIYGAFHSNNESNVSKILNYQWYIIAFTLIYSIFIKSILFIEEDKTAKK